MLKTPEIVILITLFITLILKGAYNLNSYRSKIEENRNKAESDIVLNFYKMIN